MKDKYIYCGIWGEIKISALTQKIIDTPEYQRMRFMKQLGPSCFVFPSAESSRFSHSLGVGYLANYTCQHLKELYPDLISDRLCELITIAGFTHDIGHGPFSHTFDWIVQNATSDMKIHENRSKIIFRYIVKKYKIPLSSQEVNFICETYDPSNKNKNKWKYQIISNNVDVDKFDYIIRDSVTTGIPVKINQNQIKKIIRMMKIVNNKIVYDKKAKNLIDDLLDSRKHMYKRVYHHRVAISIEHMIKKVFEGVKFIQEFNLEYLIENLYDFVKIDDSILQKIKYHEKTPIRVINLINCIFMRKFIKIENSLIPHYKHVNVRLISFY